MSESTLFQQQRQLLREFRQAVTTRRQQEQEANQRWQTEKQAADSALEQTLREAQRQHDREEARLTQNYQTARRTAEDTWKAAKAQAERLLKDTEAGVRSRYQTEREQADARLAQAKREAEQQQKQAGTQATEQYYEVVKAAEEDWAQAKKRAAEVEAKSRGHLNRCQDYLIGSGLSTERIPGEILPVAPEGITEDVDPKQMLEQSLEAVEQARIAVRGAVDALLRWRETWRRRRNWAIGIAVTAAFAVLIGLSVHSAQVHEAARQATATAYYPTRVAMATETAQAEATAQAQATATARAQATATAQAQATATAQARATATAQAQATATAQAYLARPQITSENASRLQLLQTIYAHGNWGSGIAFSPDGSLLASSAWDQTVRVWKVRNGEITEHFTLQHDSQVEDVEFSPDGQVLASSGCNAPFSPNNPCKQGMIYLYSVSDGKMIGGGGIKAHSSVVGDVAFSPDGQILASGSDDGTVRLWRVADGSLLHTLM